MNLFVNRLMMLLDPIMTLVMNFSSVAIVWFGAYLISSGNLQIGNMMAFFGIRDAGDNLVLVAVNGVYYGAASRRIGAPSRRSFGYNAVNY